jgi:preprotein translocase subunit SecG
VAILTGILNSLVILTSFFLICLVLIQRGRGGGLAGAFGGVGGSSAFGTKAGDIFTRITIGVATGWIIMNLVLVVLYNRGAQSAWGTDSSVSTSRELPGKSKSKASPGGETGNPPATAPKGAAAPSSTPGPVSVPAIPEESKPAPKSK